MARSQFQILFGVIVFGILCGVLITLVYYWEKVLKPDQKAKQTIVAKGPETKLPPPDPGKKEFMKALAMIEVDNIEVAQFHLQRVLRYYTDSSKYAEAKRILGEINADMLLSDGEATGKLEYTVKSGDSLSRIASRNATTIDYIMRANGRTGTVIHPGDKLWVAPLTFRIEASVSKKTLTVYRIEPTHSPAPGNEPEVIETFFKEYPIVDVNLPPSVGVPTTTEISEKSAWEGGKIVRFTEAAYHEAPKWLNTERRGLLLRTAPPNPESVNEEDKIGILLNPADISELFVYIRTGTKLSLLN